MSAIFGYMFILTITLIAAPAGLCAAQYTLSALIERALERSEWTASLKSRAAGELDAAVQAGAWQNPEAGFSLGQKRTFSDEGALYGLSFSQPFFYPGKRRLRTEAGRLNAEITGAQFAEAEAFTANETARLAFQYSVTLKKKIFTRERQKRFELIQYYLSCRLFPSPQQKAECDIVEARLKNLKAESMLILSGLQVSLEKLNLYADFPDDNPVEVALPWLRGNDLPDKKKWLESAFEKNFGLAAQRLCVNAVQKEKELAEKEVLPDFALSAFYSQETAGETERFAGIGIPVTLPLVNRNKYGIKAVELRLDAERNALRFEERKIKNRIRQIFAEYDAAARLVGHYKETDLPELQEKIKRAQDEFIKGRLTLLTFLELDSEITETYFRALDAQYNLADKFLTLLFLAGEKDVASLLEAQ